jgi:hypothetical protein
MLGIKDIDSTKLLKKQDMLDKQLGRKMMFGRRQGI